MGVIDPGPFIDLRQPYDLFVDALSRSFEDFGDRTQDVETRSVINYIAWAMTNYLNVGRFTPNELRKRLDTIADMYMRASSGMERIFMGQEVGDFTLVMSGMFPESLDDIKYYEQAGKGGYASLHALSRLDSDTHLYLRLAKDFPFLRHRITHARDRHMHIKKDGEYLTIKPICTPKSRYSGAQQQDGSMRFTFYLPGSFTPES